MKGITVEWGKDFAGNNTLLIMKARGKLTISEIEELLLYEGNGAYSGQWVIHINASESAYGGSGWDDGTAPKGDAIMLLQILEQESCPICGKLTPPFDYCPACGESWKNHKE